MAADMVEDMEADMVEDMEADMVEDMEVAAATRPTEMAAVVVVDTVTEVRKEKVTEDMVTDRCQRGVDTAPPPLPKDTGPQLPRRDTALPRLPKDTVPPLPPRDTVPPPPKATGLPQ